MGASQIAHAFKARHRDFAAQAQALVQSLNAGGNAAALLAQGSAFGHAATQFAENQSLLLTEIMMTQDFPGPVRPGRSRGDRHVR